MSHHNILCDTSYLVTFSLQEIMQIYITMPTEEQHSAIAAGYLHDNGDFSEHR